MLRFLFWNICKNDIGHLIAGIASERNVDVVILAECPDPLMVLRELNRSSRHIYFYEVSTTKKIHVFSRLPQGSVVGLGDHGGLTFRRVAPPVGKDILIVGVHMSSKLHMSEQDQTLDCTALVRKIQEYEQRIGHRRTIVVGDFNINPFEDGLIGAHCFHAASSRRIAQWGERVVRGEAYRFFYNPMWSHFGDRGPSPPGTYFYQKSSATDLFWNMFDQVLLRPEVLESFDDSSLEIVTNAAGINLLGPDGRPNRSEASDHLPILFALNFIF